MKPYEQRVVDDKRDLDEKLVKLNQFILSAIFKDLDMIDQCLLRDQRNAMAHYSAVLADRIDRFTSGAQAA